MASEISIKISADTQQATQNIQSVVQNLGNLDQKTGTLKSSLPSVAVSIASVGAAMGTVSAVVSRLVGAVSELVSAYSAQQQVEIQLQTTLKATQNACGMTASELLELASALSEVTTYADSEIIAVEQILVATQSLGRDIMPEATKAVLNLAAATGRDARQAAQQLARALSDPTKNINALNSAGITLTATQQENIKTIQEQSGLYEAQRAILDHVASTYGDMAESIASTDTGKLKQIGNVWQDIKEGIGEGLANAIGPALDWIYERLLDIKEIIDEWNNKRDLKTEIAAGNTSSLISMSDEELQNTLNGSFYYQAYKSWNGQGLFPEYLRQFYGGNDIMVSRAMSDASLVQAILNELNTREIQRNQMAVWEAMDEKIKKEREVIDRQMAVWKAQDEYFKKKQGEEEEAPEPATTVDTSLLDTVNKFISSNRSLSTTAQIQNIDSQLRTINSFFGKGILDSTQVKILNQISDSLHEQRNELLGIKSVVEGTDWTGITFDIINQTMSLTSAIGDLFSTMADNAKSALEEIEEKWDDYFDDLEDKQAKQNATYNALLASGNMSYEEYIDAMNSLDESRAEAEAERAAEEEAAQEKANALGEAAFAAQQANAIAGIAVSTAQAIMAAWADNPNPVVAGIMTGLISATAAVQTAAVLAQQYTPAAAGGITQGPTHALIGEGGVNELIMPLSEANLERFGLGGGSSDGGVINIVINIGTAYTGDQLAEDVFRGIERAQRTGALPSWRFA